MRAEILRFEQSSICFVPFQLGEFIPIGLSRNADQLQVPVATIAFGTTASETFPPVPQLARPYP